ncbi:hypothetical protein C8R45DRAFT_768014, partial [Mycena sanguinolenta]
LQLAGRGKKSWFGDVCKSAAKMPFHCPPPDMQNATPKYIEEYAKCVVKSALKWLQCQIDSSDKLYLIQGHLEPQKDKPPQAITLFLRHYLFMVRTQKYREALTSILLSTHLLAVERLRYVDHAKPIIPRAQRFCRFCLHAVETPEHALLEYTASDALLRLRRSFLEKLLNTAPDLRQHMLERNSLKFLKAMIYQRSTIILVAKFAYDVLELFYSAPI